MRLDNKVAIITGSTSGIGLAIAKLFASEGAKVVIAARKEDVANQVVASIKADGGEATFIRLEAAKPEDWIRVAQETKRIYGGIHVLVNNAGTNELCTLPHVDLEAWNRIMAINVTGPMLGIQQCALIMKESGGGSIVNISSHRRIAGNSEHRILDIQVGTERLVGQCGRQPCSRRDSQQCDLPRLHC